MRIFTLIIALTFHFNYLYLHSFFSEIKLFIVRGYKYLTITKDKKWYVTT